MTRLAAVVLAFLIATPAVARRQFVADEDDFSCIRVFQALQENDARCPPLAP